MNQTNASTKQISDKKDLNNNETGRQEEMRAENDKDLHSDTLSNIWSSSLALSTKTLSETTSLIQMEARMKFAQQNNREGT